MTEKGTEWAKWKNLSLEVIPEVGPSNHIVRLALADGKLFYMAGDAEETYQLKSTGITMSVPCTVMELASDAFKAWHVPDDGKVRKARSRLADCKVEDCKDGKDCC